MFNIGLDLKKSIYRLLGIPYIPEEIYKDGGSLLLHISDTPEECYSYIMKVIEKINPQYIVHTGDIVDNIKLETNSNYLPSYEIGLKRFIDSIEQYNIKAYYVMGNHDNINSVAKISKKGIILEKGIIEIEDNSFCLSHNYDNCEVETDYCLFGHDFNQFYCSNKNKLALNGLLNMNVIGLSTGKVYKVKYPMGINYYRKMERGSIGL